jgi:hypothetical protein
MGQVLKRQPSTGRFVDFKGLLPFMPGQKARQPLEAQHL